MMLPNFLPSIPQRYAFAGSAIGALLPVIGLTAKSLTSGHNAVGTLGFSDPMSALLLTVPVLSGLAFHRFGVMREEFARRLEERERAARQLFDLSLKDRLTGLPNRRALEREIARFMDARKYGAFRPAVLLIDLDKFKCINDSLGHEAGDELLLVFSRRMTEALGPLARTFRLGGDEFVVTVAGAPKTSDMERLCRMIEAMADQPFELKAGTVGSGVSIGVGFLEESDQSIAEVMRRADLALYLAKDVAGSAHAFHSEGLGQAVTDHMRLEQEMAQGLREDAFFLEYQPIMNAADRSISGFEALLRWRHPARGVMQAENFLPLARSAGHIQALGRIVFEKAIAQAAHWPETMGLSINVCGEEFRDRNLVRHIRQCLTQRRLDPRRLTIEVTGATFLDDLEAVRSALFDLRTSGVRIALDDFGTGYSTIDHLRTLPVDHLKVDGAFTRAMTDGQQGRDIVDTILRLGRAFNIGATVGGVEDQRQMDMAVTLGATSLQGYLISRPIPADTVQSMLAAAGPSPLGSAHFASA